MAVGVSAAPSEVQEYWLVEDSRAVVEVPLQYATTEEEAIEFAIKHSKYVYEWQRPGLKVTKRDGPNGHVT